MLIAIIQYIPIFGIGMTYFDFIFMKQKLKDDKDTILGVMNRTREYYADFPMWLLIFPEGTLNTPNNRERTRAYCKKNDIDDKPLVFFDN